MQLIPLNRPEKIQAAGLPFETEDSARWAHRKRHETGTADAFIQIGRRWFIDPDRYHQLVRGNRAA